MGTCFLAFSFEKRIENFLISYFIYSHHSCSSVICSADILLQTTFKWFFSSVMKSGLEYKELLNFQKPLSLDISVILDNEKNMGEWSIDRAVKTYVLLTDSYKSFETRK